MGASFNNVGQSKPSFKIWWRYDNLRKIPIIDLTRYLILKYVLQSDETITLRSSEKFIANVIYKYHSLGTFSVDRHSHLILRRFRNRSNVILKVANVVVEEASHETCSRLPFFHTFTRLAEARLAAFVPQIPWLIFAKRARAFLRMHLRSDLRCSARPSFPESTPVFIPRLVAKQSPFLQPVLFSQTTVTLVLHAGGSLT